MENKSKYEIKSSVCVNGRWSVIIKLQMAKRTKKVSIVGKFGTRYGASLRKVVKKFEITQRAKYVSPFSGKECVRRIAVGIWKCKSTNRKIAGGAWSLSTAAAITAKTNIHRLRRLQESSGKDEEQK